jgi:hypothetical protein
MVGLVWAAQRGNGPVDPHQQGVQGTVDLAEAYQHCIRCQKAWLERGPERYVAPSNLSWPNEDRDAWNAEKLRNPVYLSIILLLCLCVHHRSKKSKLCPWQLLHRGAKLLFVNVIMLLSGLRAQKASPRFAFARRRCAPGNVPGSTSCYQLRYSLKQNGF